jgi:hypothetical protein
VAHDVAVGELLVLTEARAGLRALGARATHVGVRAGPALVRDFRIAIVALAPQRAVLTEAVVIDVDARRPCVYSVRDVMGVLGARSERERANQ